MTICLECGNDLVAYGLLVCLDCAEYLTEKFSVVLSYQESDTT